MRTTPLLSLCSFSRRTKALRGNSSAEYVLPVALLSVVVIAAMVGLDLPGTLSQNIAKTSGGNLQGREMLVQTMGDTFSNQPQLNPDEPYEFCFEGKCQQLLPKDFMPDTAATDGTENLQQLLGQQDTGTPKDINTPQELENMALELALKAQEYVDVINQINKICGINSVNCQTKDSPQAKIALTMIITHGLSAGIELKNMSADFTATLQANPGMCETSSMANLCDSYYANGETLHKMSATMGKEMSISPENLAKLNSSVIEFCNIVDPEKGCG